MCCTAKVGKISIGPAAVQMCQGNGDVNKSRRVLASQFDMVPGM